MSEKLQGKSSRGTKEIKGFLLTSLGALFFLALVSFKPFPESANWLGLVGFCTAFVSRLLLGLLAYPIPFVLCYLGWQVGRHHVDVTCPSRGQRCIISLALFSSSLVLNVLSELWPSFASSAGHLSSYASGLDYTPLGGLPVFFIYKLMPVLNLAVLFGPIGNILLGSLGISFCTGFLIYQIGMKRFVAAIKKGNERTVFLVGKGALLVGKTCHRTSWIMLESLSKIPLRKTYHVIKGTSSSLLQLLLRLTQQGISKIKLEWRTHQFSTKPYPALLSKEGKTFTPILQVQHISLLNKVVASQDLSDYIPPRSIQEADEEPSRTTIETELKQPVFEQPLEDASRTEPTALFDSNAFLPSFENNFSTVPIPLFTQQSYQLPPPFLMKEAFSSETQEEQTTALREEASRLENVLRNFGIDATVGEINQGARITSFEVHPATGVKVQRIKAIESDIALNMEAKSIRILAPIPGKAAVGIEMPSLKMRQVGFRSLLEGYLEKEIPMDIPLLLGEMISGEQVIVDLTKMPHLIVAGATGSGKSVCINSIIMSILMTCTPGQVRLLMIDPKKVELSCYTPLPHLIAPVITETQGAKEAFNWLTREMEWRYEVLRRLGLRHIRHFNERVPNESESELLGFEVPEKMYFIVVIVDELADLMMTSSTPDIENAITRIAQKARAVGIHLVLATQRPSREVITGLIKANFPARVAFKVSNRVNSQIILDMVGAEELLGNGDMLFLSSTHPHPVRAQGAYVQEEEIRAVIDFICQRNSPNYLVASFDEDLINQSGNRFCGERIEDALYEQAVKIILETGVASTTSLQRRLKIGYPRAASLIDEMERQGLISAQDSSKQRKILVGEANFHSIDPRNTDEF
ncbi:FtsK/SpoIIIE family DNA translocase [Candidatus Similichlamydia laticola]|uniref:Cell division protein FtsK n=1 Tax=Candidatus Similichlamydia laticola TaxID=2170265 RepID=A0A369KI14_9BACT|nr:DNA translocase FtsK [Candidatus Similichlamydia laticola]RDB31433.1 Cell division protein FtsK [Candidatus Similichlamydia laticola]